MPPPIYKVSTLDRIILQEPTKRRILWIISKDPEAFSIQFMTNLFKTRPDLLKPNTAPNLGKALAVVTDLLDKRMIKPNGLIYKITFKGTWYRIVSHPSQAFFIGVVAIIVSFIIYILGLINKPTQSKESLSPPAKNDSVPHHQKAVEKNPDTSNNHKDTTRQSGR